MKIDNGTGGSRETSPGKPERVNARGRESINFFAELKRRNVYKVAIAYAVSGWAIAEGISQIFPVFDIPNWAVRLIVLLIVTGFPIALMMAWFFEITPEGIKRTEIADAEHLPQRKHKRAWIYFVAIGGVVAIGFFLPVVSLREPLGRARRLQFLNQRNRLPSCRSST